MIKIITESVMRRQREQISTRPKIIEYEHHIEKRFALFTSAFCTERTNQTSSIVSGFNDDLLSLIKKPAELNWRSTPAEVAGIEYILLAKDGGRFVKESAQFENFIFSVWNYHLRCSKIFFTKIGSTGLHQTLVNNRSMSNIRYSRHSAIFTFYLLRNDKT